MPDLIGRTLGGFRILEQIGLGGMATVYKAYQPSMDRYVALKVLATHLTQDSTFVKRFQQEAKFIAKLEHLHILPVYDHGDETGYLYLVMRFIEAGTLKDRLEDGPLSLAEARSVVNQVGSALEYAHQLGVVHRDLKPSNILIDAQGDCYLTDFGIAKMVEGTLGLTGSAVLGTPHYMAPEQSQSLKVDQRADVYGMGVIIYEMVTGQLPFDAETPFAVVMKHIAEPLPLPRSIKPDLPESVERVILKALAKDPGDRYQSMHDLVAAFDQAVQSASEIAEPVSTIPPPVALQEVGGGLTTVVPPPTTSVSGWPQRIAQQPLWLLAAAGLALLVLVLAGLILSRIPGRVDISSGQVGVVLVTATDAPLVAALVTPTQTTELAATATSTPQPAVTPMPTSTHIPTPSPTSTPTATQTRAPSRTPTATRTPKPTPSPTPPDAVVSAEAANLRAGPGTVYDVVGQLGRGDELEVVGRNADGDWLRVVTQDGTHRWVSVSLLGVNVDLEGITVARIPPTPTPSLVLVTLRDDGQGNRWCEPGTVTAGPIVIDRGVGRWPTPEEAQAAVRDTWPPISANGQPLDAIPLERSDVEWHSDGPDDSTPGWGFHASVQVELAPGVYNLSSQWLHDLKDCTLTVTGAAALTSEPGPTTLNVRAWIDGESQLIIQGNSVRWYHNSATAPGRQDSNVPTYLNGEAWDPTWPDVPDSLNYDCNCQSSTHVGIPALGMKDQTVDLEVIQARHKVSIKQQPNAGNDYTLIVEFDDGPPGGADWYEVSLGYNTNIP